MMRCSRRLLSLLVGIFLLFPAGTGFCDPGYSVLLDSILQKMEGEFRRMDVELEQAAGQLGVSGLTGESARATLARLCGQFSFAVDCAAVDSRGRMLTVEPPAFRIHEGKDISSQGHIKQISATRKPVMSSVFKAVEGFHAVDVEYPVSAPDGSYLGSVSLLFKPEKFLGDIVKPLVKGTPVDIWVMEKEGRILYDGKAGEIGLNLFKAKLYRPYTDLIRLGKRISVKPEGSGGYWFLDGRGKKKVRKNADWATASLYGADWRLVAIHVEQPAPGGSDPAATDPEKKLEDFAGKDSLKRALEGGNSKKIIKFFKCFYENTPGLYSVQWIDDKGVNRLGYPVENSLMNYNYYDLRTPKDAEIIKLLSEKKPAAFERTLMEGKKGKFDFTPIFSKDRYLGLVYIIRIVQ